MFFSVGYKKGAPKRPFVICGLNPRVRHPVFDVRNFHPRPSPSLSPSDITPVLHYFDGQIVEEIEYEVEVVMRVSFPRKSAHELGNPSYERYPLTNTVHCVFRVNMPHQNIERLPFVGCAFPRKQSGVPGVRCVLVPLKKSFEVVLADKATLVLYRLNNGDRKRVSKPNRKTKSRTIIHGNPPDKLCLPTSYNNIAKIKRGENLT
ncbi:MAG: hypothetical protein WC724_00650 [Candidatus Paceibacterota bacterium]